jgi:hypothetical protein
MALTYTNHATPRKAPRRTLHHPPIHELESVDCELDVEAILELLLSLAARLELRAVAS